MDHIPATSHNGTELEDRILWYDGDSTLNSDNIIKVLLTGADSTHLFVDSINNEIKQFNKYATKKEQITIKTNVILDDISWQLPDEYINLNIQDYIINLVIDKEEKYQQRCADELVLFNKHGLFDMVRVLIYVINTFKQNNIVWGVGRGSSVSSYILYLIGVHDVDCVKYDISIQDFIHE